MSSARRIASSIDISSDISSGLVVEDSLFENSFYDVFKSFSSPMT